MLIVEDDELIGSSLERALQASGYRADWVRDGGSALSLTRSAPADLVLLDLGLPDTEGLDLVRALVTMEPTLPVIMLTARAEEGDMVAGLHAGAVDYVTKPFRLAELLARVHAQLRTAQRRDSDTRTVSVQDLRLDLAARRVWVGGQEVTLRPKEFDLLACLSRAAGEAVTRETLISEVWDEHWFGSTKTLDTHIAARHAPPGLVGPWQPPPGDGDHRYAIYDPAGLRVAGDGPPAADAVVREALTGTVAAGTVGSEVVAAVPLGSGSAVTGAVRVDEPLGESIARTASALAWLSGLALAAVAASAVAGWLLLRRLLRPVTALRAAAERLRGGDFATAVPVTGLPEFDDVGRALTAGGRRIGELVERERGFSADASHQLRTPLAAVIVAMETELLSPRPDREAVLREGLQALTRMQAIVVDLLDLARDRPRGDVAVSPGELLDGARRTWSPCYDAAGRALRISVEQTPAVRLPAAVVSSILDVLLDNALAHGSGTVTARSGPTPGGVAIGVTEPEPTLAET